MIRRKRLALTMSISLAIALFSISIAFATLSSNLVLSMGNVTQSALTWNIGFNTGTVNGVATGTDAVCGSATATSTSITGISVTFSEIGDKCAYTFTIANNGNIPGKITAINVTKPSGSTCSVDGTTMVCGDITYNLRYDTASSDQFVAVNDTIGAMVGTTPTTKTVVLTAEYTGTTLADADFTQSGFQYTITYGQN